MATRILAVLPALAVAFLLGGCMPRVNERALEFTEDGVNLYRGGDYKVARECFEVALAMRPDDTNLVFNIGQCYDREGDAARAEEQYRLCLSRAANHAACRRSLELLLYRTGRRADADRMIQEWITSEPGLADAYVEEGWRLRQEGNVYPALGRLQQARALDPDNPRAMVEMGLLYETMGSPDRALQLYEVALRRDPRQPDLAEHVNTLKLKGVKLPLPD